MSLYCVYYRHFNENGKEEFPPFLVGNVVVSESCFLCQSESKITRNSGIAALDNVDTVLHRPFNFS